MIAVEQIVARLIIAERQADTIFNIFDLYGLLYEVNMLMH